ncbi:MAG: hypothetical protein H2069_04810 [Legionella sp.]|nr:hypothetical protein [Legionella sp.]
MFSKKKVAFPLKKRFLIKNIVEPITSSYWQNNEHYNYRVCNNNALVIYSSRDVGGIEKPLKVFLHKLQINADKKIDLEDLKNQDPLKIINDLDGFHYVTFLTDQYFIIGNFYRVNFYNFATAKTMFTLKGSYLIQNIALVSETTIATSGDSHRIEIRDIRDGRLLKKVKSNLFSAALTSLSEKTLLVVDNNGNYETLNIKSGEIMTQGAMGRGITVVYEALTCPKAEKIAVSCKSNDNNFIIFFDITKKKIVKKIEVENDYQLNPLWFHYKAEEFFNEINANDLINYKRNLLEEPATCRIF